MTMPGEDGGENVCENMLEQQWYDPGRPQLMGGAQALEYFSQPHSNPFYLRGNRNNNEVVRMQNNRRLDLDKLRQRTGIEYALVKSQDPVLHLIQKQHRWSPTQVQPLALYYMVRGSVFQAPDVISVLNARLRTASHHLKDAFMLARESAAFHPVQGYSWQFGDKLAMVDTAGSAAEQFRRDRNREQTDEDRAQRRVDRLLLATERRLPLVPPLTSPKPVAAAAAQPQAPNPGVGGQPLQPTQQQQQQQRAAKRSAETQDESNGGVKRGKL